jgi:sec-independent protein translocase protein TatA
MYFDNLTEIFALPQIMVVLVLALILFGPNKLPELGKQIGTALRELNKAKNDMMKSFSLDHEPDREPYSYTYPSDHSNDYTTSSYDYAGTTSTPDLTDYTIAGQPPKITAADGIVAHGSYADGAADAAPAPDYTDYNLLTPKKKISPSESAPGASSPSDGTAAA